MDAIWVRELVIAGITDPSTLACIARSRTYPQFAKAIEDALAGRCPFCQLDRSYNKVLFENAFFRVWPSNPPEKNTRLHFIIAPVRHVTGTEQLTDEEILALWGKAGAVRQLIEVNQINSRGILIRDGNATLSAGTIQHLHIHLMVPDGTGRVESPFYKGADDTAKDLAKALVFEKIRTGTPINDLEPSEIELVKGRKVPGLD